MANPIGKCKLPALRAEITHSVVVKSLYQLPRREITFAGFEREISVRYTVNGAEYAADFRLPVDGSNTSPGSDPHVGFSSKTERITLYYDPENPREAVVYQGDHTAAVYGIGFGSVMTAISSLFILALALWLYRPGAKG
jgi:hypothetical protein